MSQEVEENCSSSGDATPLKMGQDAHLRGLQRWGIDRIGFPGGDPQGPSKLAEESQQGHERPQELSQEANRPREESSEPPTLLSLDQQAERVSKCVDCDLCQTRQKTVFGVGDAAAPLMFVGEAPGHEEDLRGEPFVGKAGQLLDRIIEAMGLQREGVYIANVLKCRPPENRDPQPAEVDACGPHLAAQIDSVAPRMIVALGRPAACWLTGQDTSLKRLRGQQHSWNRIPVVATYHPAFLLRQPQYKGHCWQDMQTVIAALDLSPPPRSTG